MQSGIMTKPYIIFSGPEGSGTTYVYKQFARAHPEVALNQSGNTWSNAVFDGLEPVPNAKFHHVSLPAKRPVKWLNSNVLPSDTKIVGIVRVKRFAVRSTLRRFGRRQRYRGEYKENYDRAVETLSEFSKRFSVCIVEYEKLGDLETREQIENFVGMKACWAAFKNRNF